MTLIAFLVALVTLCVGAGIGYASIRGAAGTSGLAPATLHRATFAHSLGSISIRNLAAATLLSSGMATAGFSTIIGLGLMAIYIGATFSAAAANVGAWPALWSIVAYAPVEFLGMLLAATAGLLPIVAFIHASIGEGAPERRGPVRTYLDSLPASLRVLALSASTIVVAALVESTVIVVR